MATIQIRDIPEEIYETIWQRARAAHQSLQAYMRDQVIWFGSHPTKAEVLAQLEETLATNGSGQVTAESVAAHVKADRRE